MFCFSSSVEAGANSASEADSTDPFLVSSSSSFLSSRHLSVSQSPFAYSSLSSQPPSASPPQSASLRNQLGPLKRARVGVFFFFLFLPTFCCRVAVLTCCCPLKKELKSQRDRHLSGLSGWVLGRGVFLFGRGGGTTTAAFFRTPACPSVDPNWQP